MKQDGAWCRRSLPPRRHATPPPRGRSLPPGPGLGMRGKRKAIIRRFCTSSPHIV